MQALSTSPTIRPQRVALSQPPELDSPVQAPIAKTPLRFDHALPFDLSTVSPAGEEVERRNGAAVPLWKRSLDISCILVSLPILVPLLGAMALLIKCVSRGPVLFRQERVGYRGRRFVCLKMRTMFVGASTETHDKYCQELISKGLPMKKLDDEDDDRIIPYGQVLRSTGLDELPQLLNVLRGEMSLVGPRPCTQAEYDAHAPWQKLRFDTLPGLTGLWQVSGKNSTTFDRMIELDLEYLCRRCPTRDLAILARTVPVVLKAGWNALRRRLARIKLFTPNPSRGDGSPAGSQ